MEPAGETNMSQEFSHGDGHFSSINAFRTKYCAAATLVALMKILVP